MLNPNPQISKTVAALLLLLFMFQTTIAAGELGPSHHLVHDQNGPHCTYDCPELSIPQSSVDHQGNDVHSIEHCEHCDNCFGCHLSVMAYRFTTHPILTPSSCFSYLTQQPLLFPKNIDRPPIA